MYSTGLGHGVVGLEQEAGHARRGVGDVVVEARGHAEVVDHRSQGARGEVDVVAAPEDHGVLPAQPHLAPAAAQAHPALAVEAARAVGLRAVVGVDAHLQLELRVQATAQVFLPAKAQAAAQQGTVLQRGHGCTRAAAHVVDVLVHAAVDGDRGLGVGTRAPGAQHGGQGQDAKGPALRHSRCLVHLLLHGLVSFSVKNAFSGVAAPCPGRIQGRLSVGWISRRCGRWRAARRAWRCRSRRIRGRRESSRTACPCPPGSRSPCRARRAAAA